MNQQLITTIIEIVLGIGAIALAFGYVSSQFKRGRNESSAASSESNEILRGLIEDQKQETLRMRERQHEMINEIQVLKLNVQHIQDKREYLEQLVKLALQQYFASDPTIAAAVRLSVGEQAQHSDPDQITTTNTQTLTHTQSAKT